jgi:TRAP-type C4-dicarboxylate transport system substrate-binding protein
MSRILAFLGLLAFGAPALTSVGWAQQAPIIMKMGTATINDTQHEWLKRFAATVEQDTKGRIKVEIYPASQLGSIPRMIEQTQFGVAQGFIGPAEFMTGVDSRYQVLGAPGLFVDNAHANRVIQDPEFNKAFLALGANKGLKGLGLFLSGPATFVTRQPVRKLADFESLKLRVTASPLQMEPIKAIKATPVPMALGEVLLAFQQGTLDGVMSNAPVFEAFRYYNVARYQLVTGHMMYISNAVTSKIWFDRLPADLQSILTAAAAKTSQEIYEFSVQKMDSALETWRQNNGEVITLSAEEQDRLFKMLRPLGADIMSRNPDEKAMFELLTRTVDRLK